MVYFYSFIFSTIESVFCLELLFNGISPLFPLRKLNGLTLQSLKLIIFLLISK